MQRLTNPTDNKLIANYLRKSEKLAEGSWTKILAKLEALQKEDEGTDVGCFIF